MTKALVAPLALLLASACAGQRPPAPSLFPVATTWKAALDEAIEGPLASDGERVFVATRDGGVIALDRRTGAASWRVADRPGAVTFGSGLLVVREAGGTVWGMDPATGRSVWKADSGVPGSLPAVIAGERVLVSGDGVAALERGTGRTAWSGRDGGKAGTVPVASGAWVLVGEADGTLRCRDAGTGLTLWAVKTAGPLIAPPVVDDRQRILLGTTGRSFLALSFEKGAILWRWKLGADVQTPAAVFEDKVLVASHEDVLYALNRGNGHMEWRAPLPSRPLGGPLVVGSAVLVACQENEVVGYDARTGKRLGGLVSPAEIRTPPLVAADTLYLGLRDRSVVALRFGAEPPAEPSEPSPNP